ncbi:prolipoprotein diacylglyceryl transferase [Campylobacter jejuni]|uniref:prolipoprotein diacylglyceryl transferase n=1 Tax=Campylobacter sp. US42a TaxID=2498121 RepID=UPI00106788B8|nr:prolipoprotein diacylglyceryl transferase [Campylobacter sp. US42a]EAI3889980.1 prolipoprotein diacylglyceryl transferase [Campylobacter jejuni]EAI4070692.1 prolipoprotein diacylglyceryl transferase [Campylobacter jejuni]EAI4349783.1 prolipoprotein diacylglyceryl transferase [Campylobacter jejuni]EAI4351176.1 prolipoprotein diacylglyceryl transferase [Campylobacter jejuni]EAJ6944925.1 prolipoprotein diacylglyceryl transferase [Campylobacter jejuni]
MEFWQHIYSNFNVIAFSIFGLKVHWYGIMYVIALLLALLLAKFFLRKFQLDINEKHLDSYFIWVEIGVILGARLGYILIYDANTMYYITHPWQIFNPYINGEFVGIRGMSYHGAIIGFLIATLLFCKKYKTNPWIFLDLVALSVPLAYVFGRIGNFLNQELFGRITNVPWGIYVDGVLRHPSQLYEAFLEGIVVFIIVYLARFKQSFQGELILVYAGAYSLARFICEFYREPDFGIGFVLWGMSMGQILSFIMFITALLVYICIKFKKVNI